MTTDHLSFRLSDEFIDTYRERPVPWGFNIGGDNFLGELTWVTKYARTKDDGTLEQYFEGVRRWVEGMYSITKDWCLTHKTPWNHAKAQRSAEDAYERSFMGKWTPPGRGMWMMGTEFVWEEGSGALQNCSFLSTEKLGVTNPTMPFIRLMEQSMLGIGCGFDLKGAGKLVIHEPKGETRLIVIEDSREGWCDSVEALLRSYFIAGTNPVNFDYTGIRKKGELLKRFGGRAAGPDPLIRLHNSIRHIFGGRWGQKITETDIADVMNLIGKCVVAGNIRRSAEICFGDIDSKEFLNLKNPLANPDRNGVLLDAAGNIKTDKNGRWMRTDEGGWSHLSNNSVFGEVGSNYDHLIESIVFNGEPGIAWMDLARSHGRLVDPQNDRDYRAKGMNPCAEQTLEDNELCTLVETYPTRHESLADYQRTLKYAFMYAKAVTLLPTHWPESNEVMQRNRRIGCSMTGVAQFAETQGWSALREWCDVGYATVNRYDTVYSEWLGVRESIKTTSVKPSGTVSRLYGVTPGAHWNPAADDFFRRDRYSVNDPVVPVLEAAGYHVEPSVADPAADVVVTFPVRGPSMRSQYEVSVWEKASLASLLQRWWADNNVSVTLSFREDEADQIGPLLRAMDGNFKAVSFLAIDTGSYDQMPYEKMDEDTFHAAYEVTKAIDWAAIYRSGRVADGEKFCNNDTCEVPQR